MKIELVWIISISFVCGCKFQDKTVPVKDYEIILDEGIYIEKFDSTNTTENRYTENNRTYIKGNKLTYDYFYQDLEGIKYKFQEIDEASELTLKERQESWFLVNIDSIKDETIQKVAISVIGTNSWWQENNPNYNQTVISYKYPQVNGTSNISSSTGVIENEMNVWIHPPREMLFQILQVNPFPFIQSPYEIGNKWKWSLQIGSEWGDVRWKTWNESIENKYEYEITDKRKIETGIGQLNCYEIKSSATSSIGKTFLTAYFNFEVGFVKLDYTNIDSTRIVLELMNFEKKKHSE